MSQDYYEGYINGKPLNPNRGLPSMTYAQAEACGLTDSERLWCCTDGDGTVITADEVPYDSNNSVKDKIDSMMNWNLVGTITNTTSQSFDSNCREICLVACNSILGTTFGSLIIPNSSMSSVFAIPYGNNDQLVLSRSGTTISFTDSSITNKVCRLFYR